MRERLLFPSNGFTTGDLARIYNELAPVLLPHLAGHPLTLKRFPDEIHGECFWEKDAPNFTPAWIDRLAVPRKHDKSLIHYISLSSARSLRWAASKGCIEIHSFLHRYPLVSSPTLIAFDLDPGPGMGLIDCCSVAIKVRDWFRAWNLESFAKVSGSKGIQVYVPLNTPCSYSATQILSKRVAEDLEQRRPDRIISRMERAARTGKVFVDWSQNMEHKTTVSVYSVRAKAERPHLSMPLTWDEVEEAATRGLIEELTFTPDQAITRVRRVGDLFEPVIKMKQTLPKALIERFGIPAIPVPRPVRVTEGDDAAPRLPRSSAQGGRRLFVMHRRGTSYEFSLEYNQVFHSYSVRKVPAKPGETAAVGAKTTQSLGYLTDESVETGLVWDLGTYEIVEGSLEKGSVEFFISGRRLHGTWRLIRDELKWKLANGGGTMLSGLRAGQSALTGIADLGIGRTRRAS